MSTSAKDKAEKRGRPPQGARSSPSSASRPTRSASCEPACDASSLAKVLRQWASPCTWLPAVRTRPASGRSPAPDWTSRRSATSWKDSNVDYKRDITLGFSKVTQHQGVRPHRSDASTSPTATATACPSGPARCPVRDDTAFRPRLGRRIHASARANSRRVTAKLSCGKDGVSRKMVSDYVDLHLESGFPTTPRAPVPPRARSLPDRAAYVHQPLLRRHEAAKHRQGACVSVIAYGLTSHATLVNGLSDAGG